MAQVVDAGDVEEAYRLHREALKQSALDPATGKIDVSILSAGMSATTRSPFPFPPVWGHLGSGRGLGRKHVNELAGAIKAHMAQRNLGTHFPTKKLLQDLQEQSDRVWINIWIELCMKVGWVQMITRDLFNEALAEMLKNDTIYRSGDRVRLVRMD